MMRDEVKVRQRLLRTYSAVRFHVERPIDQHFGWEIRSTIEVTSY
jgi:hypothetical protein